LALLEREQKIVLVPGYNALNSMIGVPTLMLILADSPVPAPQAYIYEYWSFFAVVGVSGNLCDSVDRWAWINDSNRGIWHNWLNLSSPGHVVSVPLKDRADFFANFSLY